MLSVYILAKFYLGMANYEKATLN